MKITVEFDSVAEFEKFFNKTPTAIAEKMEARNHVVDHSAAQNPLEVSKANYTLEQVRAIVNGKSTDGFKDEIKAHLLEKYGSTKLPALDAAKYDEFVGYVQALKK